MRRLRVHAKGDERILGGSDFVLQVLKEQNVQLEKRTRMRARGVDPQRAAARVEKIPGLGSVKISADCISGIAPGSRYCLLFQFCASLYHIVHLSFIHLQKI
jgi:hypothetical protein